MKTFNWLKLWGTQNFEPALVQCFEPTNHLLHEQVLVAQYYLFISLASWLGKEELATLVAWFCEEEMAHIVHAAAAGLNKNNLVSLSDKKNKKVWMKKMTVALKWPSRQCMAWSGPCKNLVVVPKCSNNNKSNIRCPKKHHISPLGPSHALEENANWEKKAHLVQRKSWPFPLGTSIQAGCHHMPCCE